MMASESARSFGERVRRSSMFFVSDAGSAADAAAFAMEEHGLSADQVEALRDRIEAAIYHYFEEIRNA
jgi:hypothetical protein